MAKKDFTLTSKFLLYLLAAGEGLSVFFPTPREFKRRAYRGDFTQGYPQFRNLMYYLYRNGYIRWEDKNNKRFMKLTRKGELEALLSKACNGERPEKWDGKWRMIVYDIPEESKEKRHHFRWLLRQNNFYKLQHSVFVSPYPLNREGVEYLKQTGLTGYIRIIKIEEIDDDKDLRKHFGLQ